MALHESEQLNRLDINAEDQFLDAHENGGRQRNGRWDFNTTDDLKTGASIAQDDVVEVVRVPQGAIIYGIDYAFEAMGAGATLDIGIKGADLSGEYDQQATADDPDFFTATPDDVAAAGTGEAGRALTEGWLYKTEKEVLITLTLSGAIWAADKDLNGLVRYSTNT